MWSLWSHSLRTVIAATILCGSGSYAHKASESSSLGEGVEPEFEVSVKLYGEKLTERNGSACLPFSTARLPGDRLRLVIFSCGGEPEIILFIKANKGGAWIGREAAFADLDEEIDI